MQSSLRPYATAGVAIVGASIIAVTPVAAPPIKAQVRPVQLVDAWSDLIANTTANLDSIVSNANLSDISQVFSALLTNPFGVIGAFTNLDPTVTTDLSSLPGTISVDMPPGLELGISGFAAWGALATAINNVLPSIESNPANLYEGIATVLNGYLNGEDNISLLDGAITIPAFNGILAPETSLDVNLNLTSLIDALGLGNTPLTDLDLTSLLNQIGLGDLNLGTLFGDLGLSTKGLGDLLGDPSLGTLLSDLGLGNLDVGSLSLTNLLSDLGLNTDLGQVTLTELLNALDLNQDLGSFGLVDLLNDLGLNSTNLGNVSLTQVLDALGLNTNLTSLGDVGTVNLSGLLSDLGVGNVGVGTLLEDVPGIATLLNPVVALFPSLITTLNTDYNLSDLVAALTPGSPDLSTILGDLGISLPSTFSITELLVALGVKIPSTTAPLTIGSLITDVLNQLGITVPSTQDLSILSLLNDLGVPISPTGDLTIGSLITEVLHELNVNIPATGDIDLSTLLGDLGGLTNSILDTNVGSLLNTVDLGTLLNDLGLSNLPLNLSDLGDLSNLNLGDLLGDLGLGDLANISVEPLGGYVTLLADVVPQQILTALGM
jgi:hypothetical protein